ncbi:MAG: hypothetical protein CMP67_04440 [Flavobacteriales bacterium]|nr:hypothetical protein [Flavobacteriales bacterium]
MKKFVVKLSLFFLIPTIYCGFNLIHNVKQVNSFEFSDKSKTVIVGDSEIDLAINPSILKSAFSLAQPAEPLYHSYWKLLKYHSDNEQLKNVILGFSYHSLSGLNDLRLDHPRWSHRFFKNSYTIENINDLNEIPIDFNAYYQVLFKRMALQKFDKHEFYYDEYEEDERVLLPNLEHVINTHYYHKKEEHNCSQVSERYLDSIVNFCSSNSLNLVLITTPLHKQYIEKVPRKFVLNYNKVVLKLKTKGINVYDFSNYSLNDSCYLDYNHLNKYGAKLFTPVIDSIIDRNSL